MFSIGSLHVYWYSTSTNNPQAREFLEQPSGVAVWLLSSKAETTSRVWIPRWPVTIFFDANGKLQNVFFVFWKHRFPTIFCLCAQQNLDLFDLDEHLEIVMSFYLISMVWHTSPLWHIHHSQTSQWPISRIAGWLQIVDMSIEWDLYVNQLFDQVVVKSQPLCVNAIMFSPTWRDHFSGFRVQGFAWFSN